MALEVKNTALGPGLSRDQKLMDGFPSSFVGNGWEWRQEARLNIHSPKCEQEPFSQVCLFVGSFFLRMSKPIGRRSKCANDIKESVDM